MKKILEILKKENKIKTKYLPVTQEEIDAIHARGKITQEEKVEEFMSLGVCAPGDNIGSASNRCHKFNYKCRDCLIDYTSVSKEFYSSFSTSKEDSSKRRLLTK